MKMKRLEKLAADELRKTHENLEADVITMHDILSRKETAKLLGICLSTLDSLDIPKTMISQRVMYKRDVIIRWLEEHTEKVKKAKA